MNECVVCPLLSPAAYKLYVADQSNQVRRRVRVESEHGLAGGDGHRSVLVTV